MGFNFKSHSLPSFFFLLLSLPAFAFGWGIDGHQIVCQIAQDRLSESAAEAVKELLPAYAGDDLSTLCSWADRIKFRYRWSSELHFIDTPDDLCTYNYNRDCKDEGGVRGRCVSGAITNYTSQLLTYGSSADEPQYNLTEALLFLSHFMGDIHQPLHVGFTSDRGGNTIDVRWFRWKSELHSVWDKEIIETAEDRFYDNVVEEFVDALKQNITGEWSDQIAKWEKCSNNDVTCPDIFDNPGPRWRSRRSRRRLLLASARRPPSPRLRQPKPDAALGECGRISSLSPPALPARRPPPASSTGRGTGWDTLERIPLLSPSTSSASSASTPRS